jgi:HAD superfamily hydrolase (TIGR01509 family)
MSSGPRAIIFDFDGVIVDSEPLHLDAFRRTLAGEGIALTTEDYFAQYLGFDDHDAILHGLSGAGREATPEVVRRLMARKADAFMECVRGGVPLFPGVAEFVRGAAGRVPLAVASGALRHEIELILGQVGLAQYFVGIVSADDVSAGKPSPEGFLKAHALLASRVGGLAPKECLVVEDSLAGVEGARRAGMRCLAVTNSYPADRLGDANLVVASLTDAPWDRLTSLFS